MWPFVIHDRRGEADYPPRKINGRLGEGANQIAKTPLGHLGCVPSCYLRSITKCDVKERYKSRDVYVRRSVRI